MVRHVIKYEYDEGARLKHPISWCGKELKGYDFKFSDAQHVALAAGGSIQPCKNCIKAIIRNLEKEL